MWLTCDCGEEFGCDEQNALIANWYGILEFEGRKYCEDCHCWHDRARKIAAWIDGHKHEIASYLNLEKKRLTQIAESHPTVAVADSHTAME